MTSPSSPPLFIVFNIGSGHSDAVETRIVTETACADAGCTVHLLMVEDPRRIAEIAAALERLASELRPDVVLLSGGITQRATRTQFAAVRAFIDQLGMPARVAIPGNHDIPLFDLVARSLRPYARYAAAFGDDLEPRFVNGDVLVPGVNTTRSYRH